MSADFAQFVPDVEAFATECPALWRQLRHAGDAPAALARAGGRWAGIRVPPECWDARAPSCPASQPVAVGIIQTVLAGLGAEAAAMITLDGDGQDGHRRASAYFQP